MTRKGLEEYRSNREEIRELQYKLDHLGQGDSMMGNDTILDYRSGYPMPQAVIGVDWDKVDRLEHRYQRRIKALNEECEEIEEFIEGIEDSLTRRIFRQCFLEGRTQEQISKALHISQSNISKKISNFFKME